MAVYARDRPSVTLAEFEIRFPNIFSAFEIREKTLIYPYNSYRQYGWLQVEIYGVHDDEDLKEKNNIIFFVRKIRENKRAFLQLIFPTVSTCWFLCVSPASSRSAALQKYCTCEVKGKNIQMMSFSHTKFK